MLSIDLDDLRGEEKKRQYEYTSWTSNGSKPDSSKISQVKFLFYFAQHGSRPAGPVKIEEDWSDVSAVPHLGLICYLLL